MTKLCLIGPMGSGKSTLAASLARHLDRPSVDLDAAIEARAGQTISSIFEQSGEAAFRRLEREVLDALLADERPLIIATGGGAACEPGALEAMSARATVIWLDAPPETLAARALGDAEGPVRPLLAGLELAQATEFLTRQLDRRRPFYARAHLKVDATLPREAQIAAIEAALTSPTSNGGPRSETRIDLELPAPAPHRYPIILVDDLPGPHVAAMARAHLSPRARRVLIVSDTNVAPLYLEGLEAALRGAGLDPHRFIAHAHESSKSLVTVSEVLDAAFAARMTREDAFIALGGGVVGDLTGFSASIFQRGVPFIQVPTTLLAQVDSSVGGKTGVNHPRGKNLIGAFWQPVAVISSQRVLWTLPSRELRCGLAEAVKHGFIASPELVDAVLRDAPRLRATDPDATARLVLACCGIKGAVVAEDEREDPESGRRAILNFGHTFGHAFEKLLGYGELTHGEAVALGMVLAARLSERLGVAGPGLEARVVSVLDALGLPCDPDASQWPALDALVEAARGDKKASGDSVRFILLEDYGRPRIERLTWATISQALAHSAHTAQTGPT
jgi:3-dehydroquinate synthase